MANDADMSPEETLELIRISLIAAAQVAAELLPQNSGTENCLARLFEARAWAEVSIIEFEKRNNSETENEGKQ